MKKADIIKAVKKRIKDLEARSDYYESENEHTEAGIIHREIEWLHTLLK